MTLPHLRLAAAGLAATALVAAGSPALAADPPPPADWMQTVFAAAPQTTLSGMVIPGTHDSGSYAIDVTPPCKITPIAGTSPVIVSTSKKNPCAAAGMARAQDRNLGRQLADGIRYLDMRVGVPINKVVTKKQAKKKLSNAKAAKVPFYLHHTFISTKLVKALSQVLAFATAHPKEQIILDFQHIDLTGTKKIDAYYHQALDKILRTYKASGATVCSRAWTRGAIPAADESLGTQVPIQQAWTANRNILVLYAKGQLPSNSCYRSREKALYSPWPNTEDPAVSTQANHTYLLTRKQALAGQASCSVSGGNQCGLFVNQLQLSNQVQTQMKCLSGAQTTGCTLKELAAKVNNSVVGQLQGWRFTESLPTNIAIVDYYENSSPAYAAGLIAMNQ